MMEQFTSFILVAGPLDGAEVTFPDAWVHREIEVCTTGKGFDRVYHRYHSDGHRFHHRGWVGTPTLDTWFEDATPRTYELDWFGKAKVWRLVSDKDG